MPNKLKEILAELYDKGYLADNLPFVAKRKMRIEKSFSQIQTWIEECVGENKIVYPWANIVNHSSQLADENRENIGYNIAKAEIRERFKK